MNNTVRRPRPPRDLKKRGKALWRAIFEDYEPSPTEKAILHELCSVLDEIDVLTAGLASSEMVVVGSTNQPRPNPLLHELREHRRTADRLALALGVPRANEQVGKRRSLPATQAARARWGAA